MTLKSENLTTFCTLLKKMLYTFQGYKLYFFFINKAWHWSKSLFSAKRTKKIYLNMSFKFHKYDIKPWNEGEKPSKGVHLKNNLNFTQNSQRRIKRPQTPSKLPKLWKVRENRFHKRDWLTKQNLGKTQKNTMFI